MNNLVIITFFGLLLVVVALLTERVQTWWEDSFTAKPTAALWLPFWLTGVYDFLLVINGLSLSNTLPVFGWFAAPAVLIFLAGRDAKPSWKEAAAIAAVWVPFSFHWVGKRLPKLPGKPDSEWPLVSLLAVIGVIILWRGYRGLQGMKLNLRLNRNDLAFTFLVLSLTAVVLIPLGWWIGFLQSQVKLQPQGRGAVEWPLMVLAGVFSKVYAIQFLEVALAVALGEELLFRSLVYNLLRQAWQKRQTVALVLQSVLFGAAHLHKGGVTWSPVSWNWKYFLMASIAGAAYGWVYRKTKSLLCPIILHTAVDVTKWMFFVK